MWLGRRGYAAIEAQPHAGTTPRSGLGMDISMSIAMFSRRAMWGER